MKQKYRELSAVMKGKYILKIVYAGILAYSILTLIFTTNYDFSIPLGYLYWSSWGVGLSWALFGFFCFGLLQALFLLVYGSLFIEEGKLKLILNLLLEVVFIVDIVLSLPQAPWRGYSHAIENYIIGCIIWDCVFFILVAIGIFADWKSRNKNDKQIFVG